MKDVKVIIYDDKTITYKEGYLTSIECEPNIMEEYYLGDGLTRVRCQINGEKQSIELDPTTMQRILKYNKEVEIEKLNKEIESKKEEIKELDDKLQDREQRWLRVKNYIAHIYDMDLNEEDEDDWDWDD